MYAGVFCRGVQALLAEMCIPLNKEQLKDLMKEIDTDGSGEIDFDEARKVGRSAMRQDPTVGSFCAG